MNSKTVLLSHRYFWPDTPPYASLLGSIATALQSAGYNVEVFSSYPSYRSFGGARVEDAKKMAGIRVTRIRTFPEKSHLVLRLINALWYCICLFVFILWRRPDVVQAASFPPVVAAWTASIGCWIVGARFVYHIQDIHPEVSVYSGGLLGKPPLRQLMTWLDNWSLRQAAAVVVLSDDMRATLVCRGHRADQFVTINNFLPETHGEVAQFVPAPSNGGLVVAYAGNMGPFQGLDAVIDAARLTSDLQSVHYWFIGDGASVDRLKANAGELVDRTVFFVPRQPLATALKLLAVADVGLAPLAPDIYKVAYPSKVLTYLGIGKPVLVCVESDSELSRLVQEENIGATALPNHGVSIASAVRSLWERREDMASMASDAERLARERFARTHVLARWVEVYGEVTAAPSSLTSLGQELCNRFR